jgi:hypothetical protein
MFQRKNLIWERDSLARTTYDPEHIPDCNVEATVGKHFLFNEPIPRSENGQGHLRVIKSSLWWHQREFPNVWTCSAGRRGQGDGDTRAEERTFGKIRRSVQCGKSQKTKHKQRICAHKRRYNAPALMRNHVLRALGSPGSAQPRNARRSAHILKDKRRAQREQLHQEYRRNFWHHPLTHPYARPLLP